jgi:hypothetical protein
VKGHTRRATVSGIYRCIRPCAYLLLVGFVRASSFAAEEHTPPSITSWDDAIKRGFLPYHQLTVDDFPVKDRPERDGGYNVKTFIEPRWQFYLKPYNGWIHAYVGQWLVFSGFDRNESWRNSKFHEMKAELPYAQAILDIAEIYGRELAALKEGELPQARGATQEEARAELEGKIKVFCNERYARAQAEIDKLAKETDRGAKRKKLQELSAAIRKRLEALPAAPAPSSPIPAAASSAPSVTPVPTATATPSPVQY